MEPTESGDAPPLHVTAIPAVQAAMLIRRPAPEVFRAFVDPQVTTRFWFTRSSGPLTPGAEVRWEWEMFGISGTIRVTDVEEYCRLTYEDDGRAVEMRFTPHGDDATFVEVTESGFTGTGDELVAYVAGSTGGHSIVLCAAKALLEHDIALNAVADRFPEGHG